MKKKIPKRVKRRTVFFVVHMLTSKGGRKVLKGRRVEGGVCKRRKRAQKKIGKGRKRNPWHSKNSFVR